MKEKHLSVGQPGPFPGIGSGVGEADGDGSAEALVAGTGVVGSPAPWVVRPSPTPIQPEHDSARTAPSAAHLLLILP